MLGLARAYAHAYMPVLHFRRAQTHVWLRNMLIDWISPENLSSVLYFLDGPCIQKATRKIHHEQELLWQMHAFSEFPLGVHQITVTELSAIKPQQDNL